MRAMSFAGRNLKEMLRDPINMAFGIGFPLVVLLLLSAIQASVPVPIFEMEKLAPGMAVFGYSFVSLFSATLISKDRSESFMMRLLGSPLSAWDFIIGYTLPLLPMAVCQSAICFAAAVALGLPLTGNILLSLVTLLPAAVLFIAVGLLAGTVLTDKQVGGICGALLTNLTAWLSGTWFDLSLVGGAFAAIANLFPFVHAVNAGRAALTGNLSVVFPDLWWVIGYAAVMLVTAVTVFKGRMNKGNL